MDDALLFDLLVAPQLYSLLYSYSLNCTYVLFTFLDVCYITYIWATKD